MSTQSDKIDELVRDWYERQAMSGARVEAIRKTVAATLVEGRRRQTWVARAAAACVAMVLAAGVLFVVDRREAKAASRMLAVEVMKLQASPVVAVAETAPNLAAMTRLGFTPVVPERCKKEGYKVIGARYRDLAIGQTAVEVRIIDDDGRPQTLCELAPRRAAETQFKLDGVDVSVWHEAGLVMVMTGD